MAILYTIIFFISLFYIGITLFLKSGLRRLGIGNEPQGLSYSVIIAAHNEETVIENCLRHVLAQTIDGHRFEVILVADRCSDKTVTIAREIASRVPNLSIIKIDSVPKELSPKKYALTRAIASAQHEIIALTDADCTVPSTWLETIDCYFSAEVAMVQGITTYSPSEKINQFLFGLQAIDFLSHGIVSASAIGAGMPINSNANNLAFRKKVFDMTGGYGNVGSVISGDDDLLLQKISRLKNWRIRFMTAGEGAVTTLPTPTIKGVFEQRKRWGSKTVYYGKKQVAVLSGIFLFYCMTTVCFFTGLFKEIFLVLFAGMLSVKVIGDTILMIPGMSIFRQKGLIYFLIPASLFHIPMVLSAVVLGVFGRFRWKDTVFSRQASV